MRIARYIFESWHWNYKMYKQMEIKRKMQAGYYPPIFAPFLVLETQPLIELLNPIFQDSFFNIKLIESTWLETLTPYSFHNFEEVSIYLIRNRPKFHFQSYTNIIELINFYSLWIEVLLSMLFWWFQGR